MSENQPIVFEEMVAALVKPGADILASLTPAKVDLWHMGSCIPGEAAEFAEAILRYLENAVDLDTANVVEEIGDILFYAEHIRAEYSITWIEASEVFLDHVASPEGRKEFFVPAQIQPPHAYGSFEWTIASLLMSTAAGKVFDAVKRYVIYEKPEDRRALVLALGYLAIALHYARNLAQVSLDEVKQANIEKLRVRYAKFVYSNKAATERADKIEG